MRQRAFAVLLWSAAPLPFPGTDRVGDGDDRTRVHPGVAASEYGRVQAGNGAVEEKRVRTAELVVKQRGELVKVHGRLADDEERDVGRRNANAVAQEA